MHKCYIKNNIRNIKKMKRQIPVATDKQCYVLCVYHYKKLYTPEGAIQK